MALFIQDTLTVIGTANNFGVWVPAGQSGSFHDHSKLGNWSIAQLVVDPTGQLWCVGTAKNVGRWNGSGWDDQGQLGGWKIIQLAYDSNGIRWCVRDDNTVGIWNGTGWDDQGKLGNWTISQLVFAPDGQRWCVGTDHNVGKWNGTGWDEQGDPGGWQISQLAYDPAGQLWCVRYSDIDAESNTVGIWNGTEWDDQEQLGGWTILQLLWMNYLPTQPFSSLMTNMVSTVDQWSGDLLDLFLLDPINMLTNNNIDLSFLNSTQLNNLVGVLSHYDLVNYSGNQYNPNAGLNPCQITIWIILVAFGVVENFAIVSAADVFATEGLQATLAEALGVDHGAVSQVLTQAVSDGSSLVEITQQLCDASAD